MIRTALALGAALVVAGALPVAASAQSPPARGPSSLGSSVWPCPHWGMYGRTEARTFATDCPSGLTTTTATSLAPQWFFKTAKTVTASPVVVDGTVFVGDWSGTMYALDAASGEVVWQVATEEAPEVPFGPIVSSAAVTEVRVRREVRRLVIFGSGPRLYALDAADGSEVWVRSVAEGEIQPGEETEIETSPVVWDGVVYFGMDTHGDTVEETGGEIGALIAADAATGRILWRFVPNWEGQSGCESIWSSPTIDAENGLIFTATGNCPHRDYEWGPYQEAVIALDLRTGDPVWSFQPHEPNLRDVDFGATPNLFTDADGRRILGIGNKDAHYYALDPLTGELLWETEVAEPGNVQENFAIGGFIGSTAASEGRVFGGTAIGGPPYYHALDGATGEILWQGAQGPTYAASAVTNGVVLHGALDNVLRAYDAETGVPLASLPLMGPISSAPAVVGNQVFVGSGTSSSDACAKEAPGSELCFLFFDEVLGGTGGVHALQVLAPADDEPPDGDDGGGRDGPDRPRGDGEEGTDEGVLPSTGGGAALVGAALLVATGAVARRRRA